MQARAGTVYAPGLNYAPQPLPARTPARPPMDGMAAPASFGAQARLLSMYGSGLSQSAGSPVSPPTELKLLVLCLVLVRWVCIESRWRRSLLLLQASGWRRHCSMVPWHPTPFATQTRTLTVTQP